MVRDLLHVRHRRDARAAPRRPEVEHDDLPAKVRQLHLLAVAHRHRKVRRHDAGLQHLDLRLGDARLRRLERLGAGDHLGHVLRRELDARLEQQVAHRFLPVLRTEAAEQLAVCRDRHHRRHRRQHVALVVATDHRHLAPLLARFVVDLAFLQLRHRAGLVPADRDLAACVELRQQRIELRALGENVRSDALHVVARVGRTDLLEQRDRHDVTPTEADDDRLAAHRRQRELRAILAHERDVRRVHAVRDRTELRIERRRRVGRALLLLLCIGLRRVGCLLFAALLRGRVDGDTRARERCLKSRVAVAVADDRHRDHAVLAHDELRRDALHVVERLRRALVERLRAAIVGITREDEVGIGRAVLLDPLLELAARIARAHREHDDVVRRVRLRDFLHMRERRDARTAPRRPEVDHDDLARVVRDADFLAVDRRADEVRGLLALCEELGFVLRAERHRERSEKGGAQGARGVDGLHGLDRKAAQHTEGAPDA